MSFQGKEFNQGMKQLIINLKEYYDTERAKNGKRANWAIEQTAKGLKIGEATIRRIIVEYNKNDQDIPNSFPKPKGKPEFLITNDLLPDVRKYIRSQNLIGQHVSLETVREYLRTIDPKYNFSATTLWRTLRRWGFTYGKEQRRSALKESDYVILNRRRYLRQKRLNRNPDGSFKRVEVYLDETYVNKNHSNHFTWYLDEDGPNVNKPSGKGQRLIIVNAITSNGWVDGAKLVFEAKKRTGDYHGQMNWDNFSKWFTTQLLPNIPKNSVIIMDNASYHNVTIESSFPKANSKKDTFRKWLDNNGIPWSNDMLKVELYKLCKLFEPQKVFKIDELAESKGHSILRTPQYHPELQPIEKCWGVLKNHMARNCDFTLEKFRNNLPEAFAQVKAETCRRLINKIITEEDNYWEEDEIIDNNQGVDESE